MTLSSLISEKSTWKIALHHLFISVVVNYRHGASTSTTARGLKYFWCNSFWHALELNPFFCMLPAICLVVMHKKVRGVKRVVVSQRAPHLIFFCVSVDGCLCCFLLCREVITAAPSRLKSWKILTKHCTNELLRRVFSSTAHPFLNGDCIRNCPLASTLTHSIVSNNLNAFWITNWLSFLGA